MAASKPQGQPLAKAVTQVADINVVSEQTEAGSTVPAKCVPINSNDENRAISYVDGLQHEIYDNAVVPETSQSAPSQCSAVWDKKAVLGLDGGGIRGYSSLLILKRLMEAISHLEASASNEEANSSSQQPLPSPTASEPSSNRIAKGKGKESNSKWLPYHYFDYIAGTSTGGLTAIMLGRLRMSIDDCISVYDQLGEQIFGHPRWIHIYSPLFWPREKYNHKTLEKIIQDLVEQRIPQELPGGRNLAYDENRCRVMVLTYQASTGHNKPYIFRSYDNLQRSRKLGLKNFDRNPGAAHQVELWKIARATSAAPTYFRSQLIEGLEYLDGGIGANNPCKELLEEMQSMHNQARDCTSLMLSVGTGRNKPPSPIAGKFVIRILKLLNFALERVTDPETVHKQLKKESRTPDHEFNYYRLNVKEGLSTVKLDEWKRQGYLRLRLERCIGRIRSKKPNNPQNDDNRSAIEKRQGKVVVNSSNVNVDRSSEAGIPRSLRPRNMTLETIREHTETYLNRDDVTRWINASARILVNCRRQRAENDPQRWAKVCASILYQCRARYCLQAADKYIERQDLKNHLLDKHKDIYDGKEENAHFLEEAVDGCKIVLH